MDRRRPRPADPPKGKPPLRRQVTTLWDYPSQDYGDTQQGIPGYAGRDAELRHLEPDRPLHQAERSGPRLLLRSGTTLDVARDTGRRAVGYDVHPTRKDIFRVDARKLPPELTNKVDLAFIDPPYGTHLDYGPDPRDIGKIPAGEAYYDAMTDVFRELLRVLKPGKILGLYVSDSYDHGRAFHPLGFELFGRMRAVGFTPVDVISVVRHNKTLQMGNYRKAADEGNFSSAGSITCS